MATSLAGGVNPSISFTLTAPVGTNAAGSIPEVMSLVAQFTDGSAADQCHKIHALTYNLAASTPQTIDLQSLVLLDGTTGSLTVVRFFAYRIQSSNDLFAVTFGGAGSGEWNGWLTNGSKFVGQPSTASNHGFAIVTAPNTTGMAVSGTSHLFKLDPGTNAVGNVDVIIAGN